MLSGAHLPQHQPLSLWQIVLHYPGTQDHYDIRVATVYHPQISPSTHLPTNPKGRMRRDKDRYVRDLAGEVEGHFNVNDLRPAY